MAFSSIDLEVFECDLLDWEENCFEMSQQVMIGK
jgi:hypothetical protein